MAKPTFLEPASTYAELRAMIMIYETALAKIATGSSGRGAMTDLVVCKDIAKEALADAKKKR